MTIVVLIALFLGCAVGAFYLWRKREANPEAADLVQRIGIGGAEWLAPNLDVEDWLAGKVHRTIHPEKDLEAVRRDLNLPDHEFNRPQALFFGKRKFYVLTQKHPIELSGPTTLVSDYQPQPVYVKVQVERVR